MENIIKNIRIQPSDFAIENNDNKHQLNGLHILLVDDMEIYRFIGKTILHNMGAIVTVANNGQQALQCLEHADFDLLLIDISMPVLGGITTSRCLRQQQRNRDIPIIAMTAHTQSRYQQQAFAAGINGYLHKPFTKHELHHAIVQLLTKSNHFIQL